MLTPRQSVTERSAVHLLGHPHESGPSQSRVSEPTRFSRHSPDQLGPSWRLAGLTDPGGSGVRGDEASRSYPTLRSLLIQAAKRGLVSPRKLASWTAASLFTPATIRTEREVAGAETELQVLDRHATGMTTPMLED